MISFILFGFAVANTTEENFASIVLNFFLSMFTIAYGIAWLANVFEGDKA